MDHSLWILSRLFFQIFRVSPFISKLLAFLPRISLIPKDRGGEGVLSVFYDVHIPRCAHIKTNGTQCGSPAVREQRLCFFHDSWPRQAVVLNASPIGLHTFIRRKKQTPPKSRSV
jgi:hypothetical protein